MSDSLSGTKCPQCEEYICGATKLKAHIAQKHLTKEIKERYILCNSLKCPIEECGKEFQMNFRLVRHIGSTHNKVQEILMEKGIEVPDMLLIKNWSINNQII